MLDCFVRRPEEVHAISDLLTAAATKPATLVIEGEPGIGKTTLWTEAVDQAVEHGFHVLTSCPAETESVYDYASLIDLLAGVDAAVFDDLPTPQRAHSTDSCTAEPDDQGVDARDRGGVPHRHRSTGRNAPGADRDRRPAMGRSVERSCDRVRRTTVKTRVGMLGTARADCSVDGALSWLELPAPDSVLRIRLHPLSLGRLHVVLREALGRQIPRPTMAKIHEISGGNPFYALELARAMDPRAQGPTYQCPAA